MQPGSERWVILTEQCSTAKPPRLTNSFIESEIAMRWEKWEVALETNRDA